MMEIIDIFNENYEFIGTASKEDAHRLGYWHQVFGCLFIDSSKNKVYLQYKNGQFNNVDKVNKVDISVGGHLQSGERVEDGIREIKEESSLDVKFDDLYYLGIRRIDKVINTDYIIREFSHLFLYDRTFSLKELKSNDEEVLYFIEFDIDYLIAFLKKEVDIVLGRTLNGYEKFTMDDFIKGYLEDDQYYLSYLLVAKEYMEKNKAIKEGSLRF